MKSENLKLLFSLLLMGLVASLFANPIGVDKASKVAENFYYERGQQIIKQLQLEDISLFLYKTKESNNTNTYYIFNVSHEKGYIIVSADDDAFPILAYSFTGSYNSDYIAPATLAIINAYEQQILEIKADNLKADLNIRSHWETWLIGSNNTKDLMTVTPLLSTTWSQGQYYNADCPTDAAGPDGHALVGCVATAMAQIMNYHSHPSQGTGSHSYYHPSYGTLSVNFGSSTYDWSNMPNNASGYNTALAQLGYHCGVSVDMDYSATGSGAYTGQVATSLIDYFDYAATTQFVNKSSYSTSDWETLLMNELDNSRPMEYRGHGPDGGHAFVCDGYQGADNNHFHFNWGWGGYADGYFYVSNLNPGSYTFNESQGAVIGIEPNGGGSSEFEAPTNFTVTDLGMATWEEPIEPSIFPIWLQYDDGINVDAIGGPTEFSYAVKWDPSQLSDYTGGAVSKIKFFPREEGTSFTLKIWKGANAATLLLEQPLTNLTFDVWNEINLSTNISIDITEELWIGFFIETNGYPAGCGDFTGNPNSDIITLDGVIWEHLADYGMDFSWNLGAYLEDANGKSMELPILNDPAIYSDQDAELKKGNLTPSPNAVDQNKEAESLLGYNVYLNGSLIGNTTDLFWQYTGITPGETYTAGISAFYDNGESDVIEYDWTYLNCDDFEGPTELVAENIGSSNDVLIAWSIMTPTELVEINQAYGDPENGYFQNHNYGYGVAYDLSSYPDAIISAVDFHHASWGTTGVWDYNIHIIDWDTKTSIAVIGPFSTTVDDDWEVDILLGDIPTGGAATVAVLLEPLSGAPTDAYPNLSSDNASDPQGSIYGNLSDPNTIGSSTIGNFLMDLWIYTSDSNGKSNPIVFNTIEAPKAKSRISTNYVFNPKPVITQEVYNKSTNDYTSIGASVYRDGTFIAYIPEPDTFYWDNDLANGNYDYCLVVMYTDGTTNWSSCEGDDCVEDVVVENNDPVEFYEENFDDFTAGDYLAVVDAQHWTTWTDQPGTAEDALITNAFSETAPNSVIVEGSSDMVFPCGDLTSGIHTVSFDMYVPAGSSGYYNLQHIFTTEWAIEVYLHSDLSTKFAVAGQEISTNVYNANTWFTVEFEIDLDSDLATMYWDDVEIFTWQWSLKTDGDPGVNQLGCVNMYAGAEGNDVSLYYFDNFAFNAPSTSLTPPTDLTADLNETNGQVELNWNYEVSGSETYEDFTNGMPAWFMADAPDTDWHIANDMLCLTTDGADVWRSGYKNEIYTDAIFEVSQQRNSGSEGGSMGIYIRGNGFANMNPGEGANANMFCWNTIGYWWTGTLTDGDLPDWSGWGTTNATVQGLGESNIISAEAVANSVTFFINNTEITTVTTLEDEGYVGCFAHEGTDASEMAFDYWNIIPNAGSKNAIISNDVVLKGEGSIEECTSTNPSQSSTEIKGLDYEIDAPKGDKALQHFNVYRDGSVIGTTSETTYTDILPDYGTYIYEVTALYNEGESTTAGPEEVEWIETPPNGTIVSVNPTIQTVNTNETFSTTIEIADVTNLGSFELFLDFDPAFLQANSVTLDDFLGSTGRQIFPLNNNIDNANGLIEYAVTTLGSTPPGPDGNGVLLTIEWTSTATVATEITTDLILQSLQLTEPNGTVLVVSSQDGSVTISPCYVHDFDCDCDVDIVDVTMAAYCYGTVVGDTNYDPTFDLDSDGDIDIVDITMVTYDYGWTCGKSSSEIINFDNVNNEDVILGLSSINDNYDGTYNIELYVEDIEQLGGYELELGFNPDVIEVLSIEQSEFIKSNHRSSQILESIVDNNAGKINYSVATLGSQIDGASGNGTLLKIRCKSLNSNIGTLDLIKAQLVRIDAKVIDYTFKSIEKDLNGETYIISTYPSPFKNNMSIQYNVGQAGKIAFLFYNVSGGLIQSTQGADLKAGSYTKAFDGLGLSTGVYIVSLELDGIIVDTKKIIVD